MCKARARTSACRCAKSRRPRHHTSAGEETNPPIYVYDCSGPYTDPAVKIDIRSGLAAMRENWIAERNDTEALEQLTSEYGRQRLHDPELADMRFNLKRTPRKAKPGKNVTQMHYARQGIITPEMEYIAIRENQNAAIGPLRAMLIKQHPGREFRRSHARGDHARIRARRSRRAAAPSSRPTSTIPKSSR